MKKVIVITELRAAWPSVRQCPREGRATLSMQACAELTALRRPSARQV